MTCYFSKCCQFEHDLDIFVIRSARLDCCVCSMFISVFLLKYWLLIIKYICCTLLKFVCWRLSVLFSLNSIWSASKFSLNLVHAIIFKSHDKGASFLLRWIYYTAFLRQRVTFKSMTNVVKSHVRIFQNFKKYNDSCVIVELKYYFCQR